MGHNSATATSIETSSPQDVYSKLTLSCHVHKISNEINVLGYFHRGQFTTVTQILC